MSGTRLLFAAAFLVLVLGADVSRADSRGGSFKVWQHGAREMAMGGASTLRAPGLEALFNQPASLVGIDSWQLGASARQPTGGAEIRFGSVAWGRGTGHRPGISEELVPASSYAGALALQYLGATLADESGWGEWTGVAGAAWSPVRWISLGARYSYSRGGSEDQVDEGRASSAALGMRIIAFHPGLEFGWHVEDFHHRYTSSSDSEQRREPTQNFAMAFGPGRHFHVEFLAKRRYGAWEQFAMGAEWRLLWDVLVLRAGALRHHLGEDIWAPSLGFGLRLGGIEFDYGTRSYPEKGPGTQHCLSLLWSGRRR